MDADDGTWVDYSRWPGPSREPTLADIYAATSSVGRSFSTALHALAEQFSKASGAFVVNSGRQNGKMAGYEAIAVTIDEMTRLGSLSMPEATATLRALGSIAEAYEKVENQKKGKGRVRNHGPRPASTFDHRGRRRY